MGVFVGGRRPLLGDLYCKAGGAAWGYHRAGFDVVGFDCEPQPNYPFPVVRADVLTLPPSVLGAFDAFHASPPCQFASAITPPDKRDRHVNLIPQTRALLRATGKPFVIENVPRAAPWLLSPLTLCGTAFGLGVLGHELQRHRLFECEGFRTPPAPPCAHAGGPVVGVYGGHVRNRSRRHGGRRTRDFEGRSHTALARAALGMDWGTLDELSEAIPPAFTAYVGAFLLAELNG